MFVCQLVLKDYRNPSINEGTVVGQYNFDPGLKEGDEIGIVLSPPEKNQKGQLCDSTKNQTEVKAKVIKRLVKVYDKRSSLLMTKVKQELKLEKSKELLSTTGVFYLRILLEAEDRDKMLEIANIYQPQ